VIESLAISLQLDDELGSCVVLIICVVCDICWVLDQVAQAKKFQMKATEVLAELLKSKSPQATASKYLEHLSEEFFMVASTYLEMVPFSITIASSCLRTSHVIMSQRLEHDILGKCS